MSKPEHPRTAAGDRTRSVAGIVLAGGRSTRMGSPKALLELGGRPFLERAVASLADGGCDGVVVVVAANQDEAARLAEAAGARVVTNPDPSAEQIDSLRLAIRTLAAGASAAAVLPVDHPSVLPETVAAVLAAFREHGAPVVRPVYRGKGGHPTVFARRAFRRLLSGPLPHGARSVVEAYGGAVLDVPTEDPGVVADVDTPEDFRHLVRRA